MSDTTSATRGRAGRWGIGVILAVMVVMISQPVLGQVDPPPDTLIGGVYIDAFHVVRHQTVDASQQMREMRERLAKSARVQQQPSMGFVSLPRLFEQVAKHLQAGEQIPDELRYLGGITRLRYVFVYPDDSDIVIAGPAEPIDASHPNRPVGTKSGRPVLQLDDLITAMKMERRDRAFGCSIDQPRDAGEKSAEVMKRYTPMRSSERPKAMEEMKEAIGPQVVRLFGAPDDSRLALACLVADVKLKRHAMGIDPLPLGLPHAVETRARAANRFWFEASYEPLGVSPDKLSYQLRGPSLQVLASQLMFKTGGASPKAEKFAKAMSAQIERLAMAEPAYADLQNLADLSVLSELIRADKLAQQVNWDPAPLLGANGYPLKQYTVPRYVDTEVTYQSGSIIAGGVRISTGAIVAPDARATHENTGEQRKRPDTAIMLNEVK